MSQENKLSVYSVLQNKKDILTEKPDISFSNKLEYPKFSYGFQHFLHQSKDKMDVTDKFKGRKKVYYVLNKFELDIDDYNDSIRDRASKITGIEKNKLKKDFFTIWEILFMFKFNILDNASFVSAHLLDKSASTVDAVHKFREVYGKKGLTKSDKYHVLVPHDIREKIKTNNNINLHKTFSTKESSNSTTKDDGDITNPKTIKLFDNQLGNKKAKLVIANSDSKIKDVVNKEQKIFNILLGQLLAAIKIQDKNGSLILKIYESFTDNTVKLLSLMSSFYKDVYIVKPFTSRNSNPEKYVVCLGFLSNNVTKKISVLETMHEKMFKNKNKYILSMFPNWKLDTNVLKATIRQNTKLANQYFIAINNIIDFINKENYRGEVYQNNRAEQIEASKYWIDQFLPDAKKIKTSLKNMNDEVTKISK